jgi:hypothetical protein
MILHCAHCDAPYESGSGLHWHLRHDHSLSREEAYDEVGDAMATAEAEARAYPGYANPRNHPDHPSQEVF